jgi:hypothetical protein
MKLRGQSDSWRRSTMTDYLEFAAMALSTLLILVLAGRYL